jgi:ligand-binding SRPBCC domain-containing protein
MRISRQIVVGFKSGKGCTCSAPVSRPSTSALTWEAVQFGIKQHLTSKITAYEQPYRFTDEMIRGAFQEMTHLHEFVPQPPGTLMIDLFTFRAPLGILGRLAETLVLTRYMKGLVLTRNRYLKQVAEAGTDAAFR